MSQGQGYRAQQDFPLHEGWIQLHGVFGYQLVEELQIKLWKLPLSGVEALLSL